MEEGLEVLLYLILFSIPLLLFFFRFMLSHSLDLKIHINQTLFILKNSIETISDSDDRKQHRANSRHIGFANKSRRKSVHNCLGPCEIFFERFLIHLKNFSPKS